MRLLVDSHALIWYFGQVDRLSQAAEKLLTDPVNDLLLSVASYWEIAIKVGLGKLNITLPFDDYINRMISDLRLATLPIQIPHASALTTLPQHHRDPFDRMLVAQSLVENIPIVSADSAFDAYGITRLW